MDIVIESRWRGKHAESAPSRLDDRFSPALDVNAVRRAPPTCEVSSFGNVQIDRRESDRGSCATSLPGDNSASSVLFLNEEAASGARVGVASSPGRHTAPHRLSGSGSAGRIWGFLGPRTTLPGLPGMRFTVDVVQQHKWVLSVAVEGLRADFSHDHYFSVPAGLPVLDAIPPACLRLPPPSSDACDFLLLDDWARSLSLSCVAAPLPPAALSTAAPPDAGSSSGRTPRNSAVRSSVEQRQRAARKPVGAGTLLGLHSRPEPKTRSFDPAAAAAAGAAAEPLPGYSQFTAGPSRAWVVPGSGPSFPPSFFVRFAGSFEVPAGRRGSPAAVQMEVLLEARQDRSNARQWKVIRMAVLASSVAARQAEGGAGAVRGSTASLPASGALAHSQSMPSRMWRGELESSSGRRGSSRQGTE